MTKRVSEVTLTAAEKNIRALQKLKEQYQPNAFTDIIGQLSKSYRDAVAALGSAQTLDEEGKPIQYHFDPEKHIHETNCGQMVRSKSEVIITNTLTGYGIPFPTKKTSHAMREMNGRCSRISPLICPMGRSSCGNIWAC